MPSGIYKITNRLNGKLYVGSAIDLRKRWWEHRKTLRAKRHHSRKLQNAWEKYGESGFEFSALLICAPSNLLFFEQRALDVLKPEYNIAVTAGSNLGLRFEGRPLTEGHKAKIGAAHKGKKIADWHKERVSAAHRGIALSLAHRNKLSEAGFRRTHSDETRLKISQANKGRIVTDEARLKLSIAKSGKPLSLEHRAAISEGGKGVRRKPRTVEHCERIRAALLGRAPSLETQAKIASTKLAKRVPRQYKFSEEARRNIAIAQKKRFTTSPLMRDPKGRLLHSNATNARDRGGI